MQNYREGARLAGRRFRYQATGRIDTKEDSFVSLRQAQNCGAACGSGKESRTEMGENMKKWRHFLLALLLVFALAGCAGGDREEKQTGQPGSERQDEKQDQKQEEEQKQDAKQEEKKDDGKKTLIYAAMNQSSLVDEAIAEFNRTHSDYRIEVREYSEKGKYEESLLRFNADLVSDNAPDIVQVNSYGLNLLSYVSNGVFTDLYVLMDADPNLDRSDFLPAILKWYEHKEKLYALPLGYSMQTMIGRKDLMGSREDWTPEKLRKLAENLPEGTVLADNWNGGLMLSFVLRMGMDRFVDMETGKCYFDGEEFVSLLKLAKGMETVSVEGEAEKHLKDGTLLLDRNSNVSNPGNFRKATDAARFGGECVCLGYPSSQGGKSLLTSACSLAITERCKDKEAAWEFISSVLEEEYQFMHMVMMYPARTSALERRIGDVGMRSADGSLLPWVEALYETLGNSAAESMIYSSLFPIISEEAELYFDGTKSLEETVKVIQSRAYMFVNTNM